MNYEAAVEFFDRNARNITKKTYYEVYYSGNGTALIEKKECAETLYFYFFYENIEQGENLVKKAYFLNKEGFFKLFSGYIFFKVDKVIEFLGRDTSHRCVNFKSLSDERGLK